MDISRMGLYSVLRFNLPIRLYLSIGRVLLMFRRLFDGRKLSSVMVTVIGFSGKRSMHGSWTTRSAS